MLEFGKQEPLDHCPHINSGLTVNIQPGILEYAH